MSTLTKKVRITDIEEYQGDVIRVFKNDFEVYQFLSGYYGICLKNGFGSGVVFAGDSAWEDSYDKELVDSVYSSWNGELVWNGDKYIIE